MLSAVLPSGPSYPALPLAGQPVHQRFVRPGPLVLGTALLKTPSPVEDRDRTVSRMLIPHYCGHRLYLHPVSRGRRVMGNIDCSVSAFPISSISSRGSRYGGQDSHATKMLLDIFGGYPLRFRMV